MKLRKPFMKTTSNDSNPFASVFNSLNQVKVVDKDFWKNERICFLGMKKPFEYYMQNGFPDNPYEDTMGWDINEMEHLNLGVIAGSSMGKTRTIKQIINQYHKAGWKVLVFSPKEDEWSRARNLGDGIRLHPKNKNERLPVVSYCPAYIKNFLDREKFTSSKYKYYSHSINTFTSREGFESLGFTPAVASFCVGLVINQGINNLKDMKKEILRSTLPTQSKSSAVNKIETLISTKYFNDRMNSLDLRREWDVNNNVIAINYFSQEGFMLSSDVWRVVDLIKKYCQENKNKRRFQKVLILFDDANYYCGKEIYNQYSIKTVLNCQINYRSLGIDNITSYQFPEAVDPKIVKGSTKKLVSYVEDPSSLRGVLPEDARYIIQANEKDGGLVVNKKQYIVQWIYREEGRDFWLYYPQDCNIGH